MISLEALLKQTPISVMQSVLLDTEWIFESYKPTVSINSLNMVIKFEKVPCLLPYNSEKNH